MRAAFAPLVGVLVTALAAPAAASNVALAATAFREGEAAAAQGEDERAARRFDDAHALAPHFAALLNAATSWERAGHPAIAADRLAAVVDLPGVPPGKVLDARARLAALAPQVVTVHVVGPAGARVGFAHRSAVVVPFTAYLPPGENAVFVDGQSRAAPLTGRAGDELSLDVTPPLAPSQPPAISRSSPNTYLTYGGVTVAAVGVGAGAIFGTMGLRARDAFLADRTDSAAREEAVRYRTIANVGWVTAAAGGTAAIVGLALRSRGAAKVTVTGGPSSIAIYGTF